MSASTSANAVIDAPYGSQTVSVPLLEGQAVRFVLTLGATCLQDSTARQHLLILRVG